MGACRLFQEALQVAPNTSFSPLSSFTILYKPRAVVPHGEVFSLLFCLACEGETVQFSLPLLPRQESEAQGWPWML